MVLSQKLNLSKLNNLLSSETTFPHRDIVDTLTIRLFIFYMVYQQKWYAVTVGKKPGVYSSWCVPHPPQRRDSSTRLKRELTLTPWFWLVLNACWTNRIEAGPNTKNIPGGSIHQGFPSEEEATRAFEAAKARGEVKAYPDPGKKEKSAGKSKNARLSPLEVEASLLRAPLDLSGDAESTGLQTPLSSPGELRVAKLRRILSGSMATDSWSTSSSPPTGVTQGYAPLYEEDDSPPNSAVPRPSPHFTFTSSSSRAYPVVSGEYSLETSTREIPLHLLDVSDWDSSPSPPPGAEEHTSKTPRCMPLHPEPPSRSIGVGYRSLTELADMESVDSRVWLPKSRVFDPDKVKPRPLTRPPSPVKGGTSPVPSHETFGSSPQLRRQISLMDSPFVRAGRGRSSRLVPSSSLPIFPDWELEGKCSGFGSCLTQLPENHRTRKGKEKELDHSVHDEYLGEQPAGYSPSPRNDGRSHVQLVPRYGRDEQSFITVHCPPNCDHEICYRPPLALSTPAIEPSRPTGSRYADACVSPIITITGRMQSTDSPAKSRSERPDLDRDHPYGLAGFSHVPHQSIAPETDVRSPISKGTMVPMNALG